LMERLNVGILLFADVEVLDFAGPFEVLSRTRTVPGAESRRSEDSAPFRVFAVAKTKQKIRAIGDLIVEPKYSFTDAPRRESYPRHAGGQGRNLHFSRSFRRDWYGLCVGRRNLQPRGGRRDRPLHRIPTTLECELPPSIFSPDMPAVGC
jgi:hypothetical protein